MHSLNLLLYSISVNSRGAAMARVWSRVLLTDRSGQTGAVRYRYTGPVWPETGSNRLNSNLNSKAAVQPVRNGLPVGLTSLPAGLAGLLVGLTGNRSV